MQQKITGSITALLIFLFSYTAISKFSTLHAFRLAIKPAFGDMGAAVISILAPTLEAMIVLLLLLSTSRLLGLWASLALLTTFTIYLGYMIVFAPHRPCTCGGVISSMSWQQHIIFNIILIALTATAIKRTTSAPKIHAPPLLDP